jgi:primosomal replication protein N
MPNSMPDAAMILKAAIKYLEEELMPTLNGYHRFKTRVTANAINIVRRELEMRATQAEAERARLAKMLGHDGEVEALSRELADKIRAGTIALDDGGLRAHIRQSLADALAINNPKWVDR